MGGGASSGSRGSRRGGIVGINVTPMVDVVLVLLVIMMVSATYIVSQSLKVELPKSQSADEAVPTVSQVTITKDGKYSFNQKNVSETELVAQLRASKAANADINLVITGDTAAQYGSVVHVIDLAKIEGITKFAINIQRE
jgi:biopolymer transport protein ExbD